jgi:chlorite dismutase
MSANTGIAAATLPPVPLTIEGASVLHQMLRFRWSAWRALPQAERHTIASEAAQVIGTMEAGQHSALYSLFGHKGDLIIVYFRDSFDELKRAELQLQNTRLWDYAEPASSFLSVVELGLYESTVKTYQQLSDRGVQPHSEEWNREVNDVMERQRQAMHDRLYPTVPPARYICFYPMDRKRAELKNWYTLPLEERQRQMHEHGLVGRRYAGVVKQIISGSIGFDDWEWGVDLFGDDPLQFKKVIYEMRFDQVSAEYALFGQFFVGVRVPAAKLPDLLSGRLPENNSR